MTDRISSGFWLNIRFAVDYRGAAQSIVAIAIDLLTSEDRYFLYITAVPLPRRCLKSRQHSGSRMRDVTLAVSGPPNLRPESDHRYLSLLLFYQPITSPKLYLLQSDLSCLYKLNCNIFNHHEGLYFSLHRPASAIRHFFWLVMIAGNGRQRNQPRDCAMTWASHVLQKMLHRNIVAIYFYIWTWYNPIIGIFRACRDISIKILIYGRRRRHCHLISPTRHGCAAHSEMRYLQV